MLTIKIGGSCLFDDSGILNMNNVREIIASINALSEKEQIVVVVGGGTPARKYIQFAKELGANMSECDIIGINAARLNARLLATAVSNSYPSPAETLDEVMEMLTSGRVVFAGGFQPGQSTNMVSAVIAERTKSRALINVISVGGVFDKDPKVYPDARIIERLSVDELMNLVFRLSQEPGKYPLFDLPALYVVRRSKIPVWFVPPIREEILKASRGEKAGTLVYPIGDKNE